MFLVQYLVQCEVDGIRALLITLRASDRAACDAFVPSLPDGWSEGRPGMFYCPNHKVVVTTTVTVDGKAV
jgi:hypothetical protein